MPDTYAVHGECLLSPARLGNLITNGGWLEYVDYSYLSMGNN